MPKASSVSVSKTRPGQSKPTKSNEPARSTAKSKGPLKSILKKAPAPPSVQSDDDIDIEDVEGLPSEEDEEESGDEDERSDESEEEEPVHLKGFSDNEDDSDSSDEDDGVTDEIEMEALPTIAKDDETVKKRLDQAKRNPATERGVIYLGHVPHGFYEDEMRGFLSQFGDISRLRLSRSPKTGRSRGYAFIEFASKSVAEIVADVMNNYLLFGRLLVCKIVPPEDVHPNTWLGANKKWRMPAQNHKARRTQNKPRDEVEQAKAEKRLLKRQDARAKKLKEMGIDYDIAAAGYQIVLLKPDRQFQLGAETSTSGQLIAMKYQKVYKQAARQVEYARSRVNNM
ncbi:hypothetical protein FRC04_000364 [Tulasnella sp. 424]|nr:hypothetical protein FRC04_000364 [Tulasnella sp. 424]KAG8973321.1 hypothetical protein FRC05_008865 [Tulasnella sp. 425]